MGNIIASFLTERDLPYTWTSGRLCNFKGCDREDLQPINVAGWFWSGSGVRIAPTNSTPPFWQFQPWSHTGHKSQFFAQDIPQPDNAEEEINGSTRLAWLCLIMSMMTVLPGTMLLVTTRKCFSVRMWR